MHPLSSLLYKKNVPEHYTFDAIFDCGANTGQSLNKFAEEFPGARIHCFEPIPSTFETLKINAAKLSNVDANLHCLALSDKSGEAIVHLKELSSQNSLANNVPRENGQSTKVTLVRIRDMAPRLNIDHIDILKLDLEGYELTALRGAAGLLNERVSFVSSECNFSQRDKRQTTYSDLESFLRPFGFEPFGIYDVKYRHHDGRLDYCDALFVNKTAILRKSNQISK